MTVDTRKPLPSLLRNAYASDFPLLADDYVHGARAAQRGAIACVNVDVHVGFQIERVADRSAERLIVASHRTRGRERDKAERVEVFAVVDDARIGTGEHIQPEVTNGAIVAGSVTEQRVRDDEVAIVAAFFRIPGGEMRR